jgi:hypothetical protein
VAEYDYVAEVQTLDLDDASGGTYDLGITGDMETLDWDDDDATIEAALETVFGVGNVSVASGVITFDESVGESGLTSDFTSLTATDPSLTETTAYSSQVVYGETLNFQTSAVSASKIFFGSANISKAYLGSTEVSKIMLGTEQLLP